MFFRIKKVKGKEYAYLVHNKWRKKGPRQKVKEYLGRVHRFNLKNEISFLEHLKIESLNEYIEKNSRNRIIKDLVEWEIFKHDIDGKEFSVDLNEQNIQKDKSNVVLMINEGFLCNLTLKNLLQFKAEGDEQEDGYRLARSFVEAGIKVPREVFVGVFSKLYKTTQG